MRTGIAAAFTGMALLLAAGCGSSKPPDSTGAGTTASTSATSTKTATTSGGASIKVDTTPKFASPSKSEPVHSGLVQIAYRNIAIAPDTVRVKLGSTIRWTNYDSVQANVTSVGGSQKFASSNFGEGGTYEIKASMPGVIHYESTPYPVTMNGTIEVVG